MANPAAAAMASMAEQRKVEVLAVVHEKAHQLPNEEDAAQRWSSQPQPRQFLQVLEDEGLGGLAEFARAVVDRLVHARQRFENGEQQLNERTARIQRLERDLAEMQQQGGAGVAHSEAALRVLRNHYAALMDTVVQVFANDERLAQMRGAGWTDAALENARGYILQRLVPAMAQFGVDPGRVTLLDSMHEMAHSLRALAWHMGAGNGAELENFAYADALRFMQATMNNINQARLEGDREPQLLDDGAELAERVEQLEQELAAAMAEQHDLAQQARAEGAEAVRDEARAHVQGQEAAMRAQVEQFQLEAHNARQRAAQLEAQAAQQGNAVPEQVRALEAEAQRLLNANAELQRRVAAANAAQARAGHARARERNEEREAANQRLAAREAELRAELEGILQRERAAAAAAQDANVAALDAEIQRLRAAAAEGQGEARDRIAGLVAEVERIGGLLNQTRADAQAQLDQAAQQLQAAQQRHREEMEQANAEIQGAAHDAQEARDQAVQQAVQQAQEAHERIVADMLREFGAVDGQGNVLNGRQVAALNDARIRQLTEELRQANAALQAHLNAGPPPPLEQVVQGVPEEEVQQRIRQAVQEALANAERIANEHQAQQMGVVHQDYALAIRDLLQSAVEPDFQHDHVAEAQMGDERYNAEVAPALAEAQRRHVAAVQAAEAAQRDGAEVAQRVEQALVRALQLVPGGSEELLGQARAILEGAGPLPPALVHNIDAAVELARLRALANNQEEALRQAQGRNNRLQARVDELASAAGQHQQQQTATAAEASARVRDLRGQLASANAQLRQAQAALEEMRANRSTPDAIREAADRPLVERLAPLQGVAERLQRAADAEGRAVWCPEKFADVVFERAPSDIERVTSSGALSSLQRHCPGNWFMAQAHLAETMAWKRARAAGVEVWFVPTEPDGSGREEPSPAGWAADLSPALAENWDALFGARARRVSSRTLDRISSRATNLGLRAPFPASHLEAVFFALPGQAVENQATLRARLLKVAEGLGDGAARTGLNAYGGPVRVLVAGVGALPPSGDNYLGDMRGRFGEPLQGLRQEISVEFVGAVTDAMAFQLQTELAASTPALADDLRRRSGEGPEGPLLRVTQEFVRKRRLYRAAVGLDGLDMATPDLVLQAAHVGRFLYPVSRTDRGDAIEEEVVRASQLAETDQAHTATIETYVHGAGAPAPAPVPAPAAAPVRLNTFSPPTDTSGDEQTDIEVPAPAPRVAPGLSGARQSFRGQGRGRRRRRRFVPQGGA